MELRINKARTSSLEEENTRLHTLHEKAFTTIKNYEGLVSHEFGHLLTITNTMPLDKEVLKNTVLPLSTNAGKNLDETLAEIFTVYMYGGKLSAEAIQLFNQYSSFKI
jgi:hypothetical protein